MTTFTAVTTITDWTSITTAAFRTWGKQFSDALTAVGLAKTSDTGQIDWTTVTGPTINTYAGYEIRRLSDSIDSTYPIFLKIEYGAGASTSYCAMRISVGHASDGAGNLTGWLAANGVIVHGGTGSPSGTGQLSMCRTEGDFWFCHFGQSNQNGFFSIERRKNQSTGAVASSGDYRISFLCVIQAVQHYHVTRSTGIIRSENTAATCNLVWAALGSGLPGGDVYVSNMYGCFPEIEVMDGVVLYRANELAQFSSYTTTLLKSRTYRATGYQFTATANQYIAGVWE